MIRLAHVLAPKTLALVPSGLQAPPKATPSPNPELNRIYSWIRSSGKLNFDNRRLSAIVIVLATLCAESSAVTSFAGLVKEGLTPIAGATVTFCAALKKGGIVCRP
jgi:hypothetical protein